MSQFKPMVKMYTTEPTVELKLAKGGAVTMKKGGSTTKAKKMMLGGALAGATALKGAQAAVDEKKRFGTQVLSPKMPSPSPTLGGASPQKPSLANRTQAMNQMVKNVGDAVIKGATSPVKAALLGNSGGQKANVGPISTKPIPSGGSLIKGAQLGVAGGNKASSGPKPLPTSIGGMGSAAGRLLGKKEGGETKAMHSAEMKKMAGTAAELKKHKSMPASKAHKGLKTGGVAMGQGGYKSGGATKKYAAGGIIKSTSGETMMHTAKTDRSPAKTGGVKLGNGGGYKTGGVAKSNGGGYKKGGALKKYADGGAVQDDGRAVKMPQGSKRPSTSVSINQLSGTFKKGGKVKKYEGGGSVSDNERAYNKFYEDEEKENRQTREQFMRALKDPFGTMMKIPRKLGEAMEDLRGKPGSVTKSKESVTVTPGKKRGGSC